MSQAVSRRLAFGALLVACSGGAPADNAGAVGDRFVDLYVVEVDQKAALALATGNARKRLEQELTDVASVRAGGYRPSAARASAYYTRTSLQVDDAAGTARAVYDLTLKQSGEEHHRHILVSLHTRDGGHWRVAGFFVEDGPAAP